MHAPPSFAAMNQRRDDAVRALCRSWHTTMHDTVPPAGPGGAGDSLEGTAAAGTDAAGSCIWRQLPSHEADNRRLLVLLVLLLLVEHVVLLAWVRQAAVRTSYS